MKNWTEKLLSLNKHWKKSVSDLEFGIGSNVQISDIESVCESVSSLPEIDGTEALSEIKYLATNVATVEEFIASCKKLEKFLESNKLASPKLLAKGRQKLFNLFTLTF